MTPRLFIPNFDFEHALAAPGAYRPTRTVRRLSDELAGVWIAVAKAGDFLWTPTSVEGGFFSELAARGFPLLQPVARESEIPTAVEVCPWGWTDELRRWAERPGCICSPPSQAAVRRANSRRTSFELEREWDVGLAGTAMIRSAAELANVLKGLAVSQPWVIKAEFGMSARERILGGGPDMSPSHADWIRKRLDRDGAVFFEPWVERLDEAGMHFTIPSSGSPEFNGVARLISDAGGHYRGNEFAASAPDARWWDPAIPTGWRAAERLQSFGYFGPLGIDVMQYRDPDGTVRVRPIQDVNARFTMGRLALGFRRQLQPGETGRWLHLRWNAPGISPPARLDEIQQNLPPGSRVIRTSPFEVGGRPTQHGTVLCCIAPGAGVRPDCR